MYETGLILIGLLVFVLPLVLHRVEENLELFKAICDQFIETATYIKKELTSCQG